MFFNCCARKFFQLLLHINIFTWFIHIFIEVQRGLGTLIYLWAFFHQDMSRVSFSSGRDRDRRLGWFSVFPHPQSLRWRLSSLSLSSPPLVNFGSGSVFQTTILMYIIYWCIYILMYIYIYIYIYIYMRCYIVYVICYMLYISFDFYLILSILFIYIYIYTPFFYAWMMYLCAFSIPPIDLSWLRNSWSSPWAQQVRGWYQPERPP